MSDNKTQASNYTRDSVDGFNRLSPQAIKQPSVQNSQKTNNSSQKK